METESKKLKVKPVYSRTVMDTQWILTKNPWIYLLYQSKNLKEMNILSNNKLNIRKTLNILKNHLFKLNKKLNQNNKRSKKTKNKSSRMILNFWINKNNRRRKRRKRKINLNKKMKIKNPNNQVNKIQKRFQSEIKFQLNNNLILYDYEVTLRFNQTNI